MGNDQWQRGQQDPWSGPSGWQGQPSADAPDQSWSQPTWSGQTQGDPGHGQPQYGQYGQQPWPAQDQGTPYGQQPQWGQPGAPQWVQAPPAQQPTSGMSTPLIIGLVVALLVFLGGAHLLLNRDQAPTAQGTETVTATAGGDETTQGTGELKQVALIGQKLPKEMDGWTPLYTEASGGDFEIKVNFQQAYRKDGALISMLLWRHEVGDTWENKKPIPNGQGHCGTAHNLNQCVIKGSDGTWLTLFNGSTSIAEIEAFTIKLQQSWQ